MVEKIMDGGWDGRTWIPGRLVAEDSPPPKEPEKKVTIPEPRCVVTQHLIYVRYANPGSMQPPFGTTPADWGSLSECRARAKELGNQMNLPVVEISEINPDLKSKVFASPAIYICCEQFDQWSPSARGRVFRY